MDVVFSLIRFTNNSIVAVLPQILSRLFIVFVVFPLVEPQLKNPTSWEALGIFLCVICWSLTEVIRFGLYFMKPLVSDDFIVAKIFGHFRYNLFILAYPLGVTGEMISLYFSYIQLKQTPINKRPLTIHMPNQWNFVFDLESFIFILPVIYLIGFPQLYIHMIRQRARFYSGGSVQRPQATAVKKTQ